MNNITGYTHFRSYHDSIKDLDKEDRRDILEAIDDFMFDDDAQNDDDMYNDND